MDSKLDARLPEPPSRVTGKGPEELRRELGLDALVNLASNENPLGPSPLAVAAARKALDRVHRYPDWAEGELERKLVARCGEGLTEDHVIVGNGAVDVLRMVAQAFLFDGGAAVMCRVAFPMYRLLTATFGGTAVPVGLRADYGTDLAAMAGAVTEDTRIVWLCSPNNPTGLVIRQDEMDAFVARLPDHVVVVYDEPYRDFVTDPSTADGRRYVLAGRPVILVRSFSKSGGLAGLRVGYGIGPPDLIGNLSRTVMPYNTGQVAMIGAAASLDDDAHLRSSRELVWRERAFLQERLSGMGLTCLESQANFLLVVDPPVDAADLAAALLRRGVLVRAMAGFGMENGLRVTVGLREENERFLDALTAVLGEQ